MINPSAPPDFLKRHHAGKSGVIFRTVANALTLKGAVTVSDYEHMSCNISSIVTKIWLKYIKGLSMSLSRAQTN